MALRLKKKNAFQHIARTCGVHFRTMWRFVQDSEPFQSSKMAQLVHARTHTHLTKALSTFFLFFEEAASTMAPLPQHIKLISSPILAQHDSTANKKSFAKTSFWPADELGPTATRREKSPPFRRGETVQ